MLLCKIILSLSLFKFVYGELLQVHVLFSTKEYVPFSYPGDIYTKFPHFKLFSGSLTEKGQLASYKLGSHLEKRYHEYLPELYSTNVSESFSTNTQAAQESLQCVHLGLFPPSAQQTFSELNWQPIPYRVLKGHKDKFLSPLEVCNKSWNLPSDPNCAQLTKLLTEKTGHNVSNNEEIFHIFDSVTYQRENKFDLPLWLDREVYEYIEVCSEAYYEQLRQLRVKSASGALLHKITTMADNKKNNLLSPPDRKIFLYSGNIYSVPLMLTALSNTLNLVNDGYSDVLVAKTSSLLFELHNVDGVIGLKLFYQKQLGEENESHDFQSLNTFISLEEFMSKTGSLQSPDITCF